MFYHVSSYVKEGQLLTHKTKNNFETCEQISKISILQYDDYSHLLNYLEKEKIKIITGKDHYKWSCEAVFETIRNTFYSNKPSRIWGIYLTDSIDKARLFNQKYRNGNANIFEIQIPEMLVHKFDMDMFTNAEESLRNAPSFENYNKAIKIAHDYWKGDITSNSIEFLTDIDIIVGKQITPNLLSSSAFYSAPARHVPDVKIPQ